MRRRCVGFDRIIDTDIAVPGAIEAEPGDRSDATIRIELRAAAEPVSADAPIWAHADGVLDFSPPGVARYRCTAHSVTVTPDPTGRPSDIAGLLVATALPATLWLQGALMLHAAAVLPPGETRALAIAGASGIGKSMLAAAFLRTGAKLVADDSIAVRAVDGGAVCSGLAGGYHLGTDGEGERRFHRVATDASCRSVSLGAIVVLQHGAKRDPHRLDAVRAVEALLANRHRPNAPCHAGMDAKVLHDAAFVARAVPIYRWPADAAHELIEDVRRTITMMGDR